MGVAAPAGVDEVQGECAEVLRHNGAARRSQARGVLEGLQKQETVREVTLRSAAGQSRAQGGLPLSPQRHERALSKNAVRPEVKIRALWVQ